MKVIGAGFGRTGTMSLKVALQQLGFGPCLHMIDFLSGNPHLSDVFREAYDGKTTDWKAELAGWESAVDWPGCSFYKEFMKLFPDAPVVLNVRDPEGWYKSTYNTIYQAAMVMPQTPEMAARPANRMLRRVVWEGDLQSKFEDKPAALAIFESWNQGVRDTVPSDRLLEFNVIEGWKPLCDFLGQAVPDEPFPHLNDTQSFLDMVQKGAHMTGEKVAALNR
jgi:Sulfotransferase domain